MKAGSLTFPPWEPAFRLVKPLRKSVNPFGGDLCFGWLGSLRLYLYKPLGCVSTLWKWMPARKDKTMQYQNVFEMPESIPYLSVGLDVGADFTWMSIMLPNGILTGKPFKIIHADPQSRELAVTKIKEAQEMYSLESHCFLESTGIYCPFAKYKSKIRFQNKCFIIGLWLCKAFRFYKYYNSLSVSV